MKALLITACNCSQVIEIITSSREIVIPLPKGGKRRFVLSDYKTIDEVEVTVYHEILE